jgi:dTDP-4-dehydrorhamnose reductase
LLIIHLDHPYSPADVAIPATSYGRTKLAFEEPVLSLANGVVLRLSNMIGPKFAYESSGTKFFQFLYEEFQKRSCIGLRDDEIRSFVYVQDVIELIWRIASDYQSSTGCFDSSSSTRKLFHVGGPKGLSRLDLGMMLASVCDDCRLIVQPLSESSSDKPLVQSEKTWTVYRTSNAESIRSSGIANPRDVSMDCSLTEEVFRMKFDDITFALHELIGK